VKAGGCAVSARGDESARGSAELIQGNITKNNILLLIEEPDDVRLFVYLQGCCSMFIKRFVQDRNPVFSGLPQYAC
jgi:hypothetical protein